MLHEMEEKYCQMHRGTTEKALKQLLNDVTFVIIMQTHKKVSEMQVTIPRKVINSLTLK